MANGNVAFGLMPVRMANGDPYNGASDMFYVPATDGTALYIGDPVILAGSADSAGVASVTRASASAAITGVVVGFGDATSMTAGYRAASTAAYVNVVHGADVLFEIQEDSVGGALAATDIGLNANIIVASGSAYTKRSGVMLDTNTKATDAALPLKIVGLAQRPDNAIGDYANVLVRLNNVTDDAATVSAGI
jgi:hypothetical protein